MESKNDANQLIYKIKADSLTEKTNLWLAKGKEDGDNLEVWESQTHSTMYKIDNNSKDPFYSTGNCTQYLVIIYNGKEYVYVYEYMELL